MASLRFHRSISVAACVAALAIFHSPRVHAQAGEAVKKAEAAYKEGLDLAKAGKNESALQKFEESSNLAPSSRAVFQIARMEEALGRADTALFHYRQALKDPNLAADHKRDATRAVTALKAKVATITVEVPQGSNVVMDGIEVPDPTAPLEVKPGTHQLRATLGDETGDATITCDAGKTCPVTISLHPPTAAEPKPNTLPSTQPNVDAPPKSHLVPESSFWTTGHVAGVGLAGVAVMGVGLGVVFSLSHSSDISKQEDVAAANPNVCADVQSPSCRSFDELGDSAASASTAAIVSFGIAGAAAVGAAILLWPSKSSATGSTRIMPRLNGVTITGAF